jgi:hypothetical protein
MNEGRRLRLAHEQAALLDTVILRISKSPTIANNHAARTCARRRASK